MTIEIVEFRCPTCGHTMGEKEYREAHNKLNRDKQEIREELTCMHQEEMQLMEAEHTRYVQELLEKNDRERQRMVDQEVQVRTNNILSAQEEKHQQEISKKDEEIEAVKSQSSLHITEKIEEAVKKEKQERTQTQLLLSRVQEEAEKMRQTIENIPPEFRGTAGELVLLEELRAAFPHDDLIPKIVGVEMPDVVQITESGERIRTPILWDMKTGKDVLSKDIEKAKRYKEKYDTDHCIIVTSKGITARDSKSYRISIIGKRENVVLIHPKIVGLVGELTRSFIIEKTQAVKNSNGRDSKEKKLYDYITSSTRFRKMRDKIEKKLKLDELQRKEEAYVKKTWIERNELIQGWYDLDKEDQERISAITQTDQNEE
jgi:hypothetical protein